MNIDDHRMVVYLARQTIIIALFSTFAFQSKESLVAELQSKCSRAEQDSKKLKEDFKLVPSQD